MLYLLAINPEAQEKPRSEIQRVVGSDQIVTPAHINEMTYLRSALKETLRSYFTISLSLASIYTSFTLNTL